jgi:hypothetical protein
MRLIYLLASDADAAAAAEIEALLKQRGYQVRRADEKYAYPPARYQEITLALWSKAVQFSSRQILFTNRAIDAWTEGRLIFARLDHSLLPRGLGDIETIDLTFAPARVAAVWKIVEAAQEIDRAMEARRREAAASPGGGEDPAPPQAEAETRSSPPKSKRRSGKTEFSSGAGLVVGLVAAAAFVSLGFLTMPAAPVLLLGGAAIAWGGVAGALGGFLGGRKSTQADEPEMAAAAPAPAPPVSEAAASEVAGEDDLFNETPAQVFVSYSRSNGEVVYPLVAEVEAAGRDVWIDREELQAGTNWAGMIVRAIRDSDTFCLMCTAEAFQSDNVRREIYIADKYKRKLLPVRLDFAQMPEDFEYFLIDRQWLDLTATNPEERALRLKAALGR